MKSPQSHPSAKKAKARVPKARIGCVRFNETIGSMHLTCPSSVVAHETDVVHYAVVLPMPTLKAARARMRFEGMDREAKVEALAKAICDLSRNWEGTWDDDTPNAPEKDGYRMDARACLRVIEGETT